MQFWLIFAQIRLPWQLPWKFRYHIWFHEAHKTLLNMRKIYRFLARNRNLCNFGLFFSEFGCHGNSLGSLENWDSIFEVAYPKTWLFMRKSPRFFAQNWNQCNFGFFVQIWLSLVTLKILIAYWNSPAPKSPLYVQKIARFLAEKWWVQFFAQIWLPWQPPWLPLYFIYHIWIRRPQKPFNYVINSSIFCTGLKSVQFWLIFD